MSTLKKQYKFFYDRYEWGNEVLENILSDIGEDLREKGWEKDPRKKYSREGKLVIVGIDIENEQWIINDVNSHIVSEFQEKSGAEGIPMGHPARRSLCCISVYDVTDPGRPIMIAGIRHPKAKGFSRLLPECFEISTWQLPALIKELNKLKLLKISDPNIKWIID